MQKPLHKRCELITLYVQIQWRKKYSSVKGKKDILSSQSVQQNVHRKQQQKSTAHFHVSRLCLYFPTYTCELVGKGGGRELVIIFFNACSTMTIIS